MYLMNLKNYSAATEHTEEPQLAELVNRDRAQGHSQ